MASGEKRLSREELAAIALATCKEIPCGPVASGAYGMCSICPWRGKKT
jgi:hypothetical protein